MSPAQRVERVVRGVCAEAVRAAAAGGIIVLDDWTPEGELVYEWLVRELGEAQVWRAASVSSNVQGLTAAEAQAVGAWRSAQAERALVAHPANRTALLLGGRLPAADLLPLGDVWASEVEALTGRWSAPPAVESFIAGAGSVHDVDVALRRLVEQRAAAEHATAGLPPAAASELLGLYRQGQWWRLRPRIVPKLGTRTIGIDLFD
jgi:hypothetical protein